MVDSENLKNAIRSVLPYEEFIPLHEPKFSSNALKYVTECVSTGWVSTAGGFVNKFEQALASAAGANHAIAVSSGTAALHLALVVAGVEEGDEVICPGLSFVATANAIRYVNAIPHFIDVSDETMCIDADYLCSYLRSNLTMKDGIATSVKTGRKVSAVLGVHAFGFAMDTDKITEVCTAYKLIFIEDAACSIGSEFNGQKIGSNSKLATMSFNGNKLITCGGGGAVLTDCAKIAEKIKHLSTTAKTSHRWEYFHDEVGFNYRLPNINAALGLAELEKLDEKLEKKRSLFEKYRAGISNISGVTMMDGPPGSKPNFWLICARLDTGLGDYRDELLAVLNDAGLMSRPLWSPLSRLPMFVDCPASDQTNVENLHRHVLCLPSSPHLAG